MPHDLLIGGDGADRINGGAGNDILVAANIVNPITLAEDTKFSHLVAALNGGPIVADDDGDVDVLTGAAEPTSSSITTWQSATGHRDR